MIAFSCAHCGMKFKVQDQHAGRPTRCPTCKQRLIVPAAEEARAAVPHGQIDGTSSSLHQAGIDGGVTLEQAARRGQKAVPELLARRVKNSERYLIEGEIARGGMGAVLRAVDCDIRREVAVKYMLSEADPKKKLRFVEEAQITGQLEHPNIVPIHELGVDKEKRLFFAMKMVKGRSLAEVLDDLRDGPSTPGADATRLAKEYSVCRLLNILVNVCHALAYAHALGVVHRDLKPANIMTGDFGEVYVMDWGLAKVLKSVETTAPVAVPAPMTEDAPAPQAVPLAPGETTSGRRSSKVQTVRQPEADLTQDGAIVGTPAYMPPEQASGQLNAIDQRSDIYSLGAILYEMLTLEPPVEKEGGYLAILYQVMQGQILPPAERVKLVSDVSQKRGPVRPIPLELSAIAMKALAKNKEDRYPNVEALRRDIELFLEGRSVSAKQDTFRELLWKLVKRNKAVSAATFVFLAILASVLGYSFKQHLAYLEIQKARDDRTRLAVPALIEAAKLAAEQQRMDNALTQVDIALAYDESNVDARLLKGQLLIVLQQYVKARAELDQYMRLKPTDPTAKTLVELCRRPQPDDTDTALRFAAVFGQQKNYALEVGILRRYGKTSTEARTQLLEIYRKRIEEHWPGEGKRLTINVAGLDLNFSGYKQLASLEPLRGMPLTSLKLEGCLQVRDLSPLQGMPLSFLDLHYCQITDLSGLRGLPLASLHLQSCPLLQDLSGLQGLPLTTLNLWGCGKVHDLSPLHSLPLTALNIGGSGVHDLTPLESTMTLATVTLNGNVRQQYAHSLA